MPTILVHITAASVNTGITRVDTVDTEAISLLTMVRQVITDLSHLTVARVPSSASIAMASDGVNTALDIMQADTNDIVPTSARFRRVQCTDITLVFITGTKTMAFRTVGQAPIAMLTRMSLVTICDPTSDHRMKARTVADQKAVQHRVGLAAMIDAMLARTIAVAMNTRPIPVVVDLIRNELRKAPSVTTDLNLVLLAVLAVTGREWAHGVAVPDATDQKQDRRGVKAGNAELSDHLDAAPNVDGMAGQSGPTSRKCHVEVGRIEIGVNSALVLILAHNTTIRTTNDHSTDHWLRGTICKTKGFREQFPLRAHLCLKTAVHEGGCPPPLESIGAEMNRIRI